MFLHKNMNNLMNNITVFCISLNLNILGILILHFSIIQKKSIISGCQIANDRNSKGKLLIE